MILLIQILVLGVLAVALTQWLRHLPYPSPLVRPLLPSRQRWPELQIREWLETTRFHPGYLRFFYRDPPRVLPADDGIIAPADGLVTSYEARAGVRYIVIALSFWDMHVQRSPLDGRVTDVTPSGDAHMDGEGRDFAFLRDKYCPVQTRIALETDIGPVAIRLITSVAARRIETWVQAGEQIRRGQRVGRILLGSTVVLEVPDEYVCTCELGSHVRAGETILAAKASV